MSAHGRVERTSSSPADPTAPVAPAPLQRSPDRRHPHHRPGRDELARLAAGLLEQPTATQAYTHRVAVGRVLDWLEQWPGDRWQDRWLLSGSDDLGQGWGPVGLTDQHRGHFTRGLRALIVLRAVAPSYPCLSASRLQGLYDAFRQHNQPEAFGRLTQLAGQQDGAAEHAEAALNALTRIAIATARTC